MAIASVLSLPVFLNAQDEDDANLEELESFTITGSNIKRIDQEPINPVLSLTSDTLKDQGFTTVGDKLRSLSFNNGQALTPADSGTSFTPGVSTLNLRGLGNNQTLVLINGRRAAPYAAPGFDGLQTVFDLNSIPEGAIDRIDILKDGASAIYGSDAVAGVINVILKDEFEGLNVRTMVGDFFNTGALYRSASATVGTTNDNSSILVSVSFEDQEAVLSSDLGFSSNADQSNRANGADPYWSLENYDTISADYLEAVEVSSAQQLIDDWIAPYFTGPWDDPASDGWFDNRSSRGFPGYLRYDFNGNGSLSGSERRSFYGPTANPTVDDPNGFNGYNPYNYQEASGLFPEYRRYAFYTRATYDFTDFMTGILELSFSRVESEVYSAATPVDIESSRGIDPGEPMVYPAFIPYDYDDESAPYAHPYNPWGVDFQDGRRRLVEFPARLSDVTSDTPRIVAALEGTFGSNEDWNWETGYVYSKNKVDVINVAAADSRLQQAIFGLTRLGDGSLSWDPNTPPEDRVYFNWFDINEQAMVDFITVLNPNSASFELTSVDAKVNGTIGELPGGPAGVALGIEHRTEDWTNVKTDLNATADILGGSEGTSSSGSRILTSLFAEVILPVHDMVELQFAARFENYSDKNFDEDIRPKAAIKIQPVDWLLLRASYSESFKAPDLAYLYTASTTTFTSGQLTDPVTGDEIDQLQIVVSGNPELKPETSKNVYAGVVFDPGQSLFNGALDGLTFSVEYFKFDRENLLAQLSDFFGYAEFITGEASGDETFAGKVVRDANNTLLYIRDDYANISESTYEGFDFGLTYSYQTEDFGNFYFGWNATWLTELSIDGGDLVGNYLTPEIRHTFSFNWNKNDWRASIFGSFIAGQNRTLDFYGTNFLSLLGLPENPDDSSQILLHYRVKAQWLWNVSATYSGFAGTDITVGVDNVFGSEPPVDPYSGVGALAGVNYLSPAFWYVRLEHGF